MGRFGTLVVSTPGSGEMRYGLDSPQVSIGRGAENDVVALDIKVSRRHAVLHCSERELRLVDVGSSNGFKFNGQRVREAVLTPRDDVVLGNTSFRVERGGPVGHDDETAMTAMGELFEASITDHSHHHVVITEGGRSRDVRLKRPRTVFGRAADADVVIDHPKVSRNHAEIVLEGEAATLRDLGSRNGTLVNGQPVESVTLDNGDTFEVGEARVVYKAPFTTEQLSVIAPSPLRGMPAEPARGAATGLSRTAGQVARKSAARSEGPTQEAQLPPSEPVAPPPLPRTPRAPRPAGRLPVIVVPGFMGSTLYRGETMVWPAPKTFLKNPEILKLPEEKDLEPRGLVNEVVVIPGLIKLDAYNRLVEYLVQGLGYQEGKDLFVCAYDWRMDLRHGAGTLGNRISEWEELSDKAPGKFIIIAHSAGCLVARYYVERMGGRHHVERLILLGGPHQGTPKPLYTLLGAQSLIPFGMNKQRMKETMGTFLSAYQLLPNYPVVHDQKGPVDLLNDDTWVPEKARLAIKDARNFYEELGNRSRVPVVSIFGYGQKTLARVEVRRGPDGDFLDPKFIEEECGDGTVAQDSAILAGSEIHPVQQQHGALYTDNDVKMRLKLELLGKV
ncbi:MAG: FHA domain-containing protein [Myxococcota bacterium]